MSGRTEKSERKKSNPGCRRRFHEASGIPRQSWELSERSRNGSKAFWRCWARSICWDCYERCSSYAGVPAGLDRSYGWRITDWCCKSNVGILWISGCYIWRSLYSVQLPGIKNKSKICCNSVNIRNSNRSNSILRYYQLSDRSKIPTCRF